MSNVERVGEIEPAAPSLADRIDQICDKFERAELRGESPRIEAFLDENKDLDRGRLLVELLLVDRELRIRCGESATRDDYLQRFPEYSSVIKSLEFATIDDRKRRRSPSASVPNLPGTKLAHFELLEEVGNGASGTVWKARDTRLCRLVAVKIPRKDALTKDERERFIREGQACAQLWHPNIVAVHEIINDSGQFFIVSELIDGPNLRDWLRDHRPAAREAAELTAQLAEALHHAHEQGIIHRDFKPANVLLDGSGRPHITDFGLAKWTESAAGMTVEGNVLGTPAYMSPEQARGDAYQVDRRSDVYALGTLLYELLAGRPPFDGDVVAIIHKVTHEEPSPPRTIDSAIPRDLETVCLKAMEKEPSRRYPSAQEMAVDLRRYLRGEPILSRRATVLEKSWRRLRRHRSIAAAAVLLIIVIATAGIIIKSLNEKNYRLQGYRPVRLATRPSGARVAIVPIDAHTGEPDPSPASVIRPLHSTPLTVNLKPGRYLIEAAISRDPGSADYVELIENVLPLSISGPRQMAQELRNEFGDEDTQLISIVVPRSDEVLANMIAVPIDDDLRIKNPLLPNLLYVQAKKTKPGDLATDAVPFERAEKYVQARGLRLPTAAEYDAITKAAAKHTMQGAGSANPVNIDDLVGGMIEWTVTKYTFAAQVDTIHSSTLRNMHVLKAYDDAARLNGLERMLDGTFVAPADTMSPLIAFRGVRSGSPRFVRP